MSAATATAGTPAPADPWERLNRAGYSVQGGLDRHLFHPLAKLYHTLTPGLIGVGIHNVLVNLSEPVALINDLLQWRFRRAGVAGGRFITNSTLGVLGLFDVATRAGLMHHDNEFGVTLGRFGLASGPYLYVPLFGPSSVRDFVGSGLDFLMDPMHWLQYANRTAIGGSRFVVSGLDLRVRTQDRLDALLSGAIDPYATLRSAYLQNKQGEVEGGGAPLQLPSFDEPAPAPAMQAPGPIPQ